VSRYSQKTWSQIELTPPSAFMKGPQLEAGVKTLNPKNKVVVKTVQLCKSHYWTN